MFEDYEPSGVRAVESASQAILARFLRGGGTARSYYIPRSSSSSAYEKIWKACRHAKSRNHNYIWIDTCCIDKRSSHELSEAINSMWRWYRDSEVCFAYLADVPYSDAYLVLDTDQLDTDQSDTEHPNTEQSDTERSDTELSRTERSNTEPLLKETDREAYNAFIHSRWFTRGWTLQELIAPRRVHFLSSEWKFIGSKKNLSQEIAVASGLNEDCLDAINASAYSTYMKMSLAARRETTREEDAAYCLLGLFGINMPLLYGEGRAQALKRLQLAIVEAEHDPTLLGWSDQSFETWDFALSPFPCFASSAKHFLTSYAVVALNEGDRLRLSLSSVRPYSMTNLGLHINLPVTSIPEGMRVREGLEENMLGFYAIVGKMEAGGGQACVAIPVYCYSKPPAPARRFSRFRRPKHSDRTTTAEMMEDNICYRSRPGIALLPWDVAGLKERWFYLGNVHRSMVTDMYR